MIVQEPGHKYKLSSLDGQLDQTIFFVKRSYEGLKVTGLNPGTTCQDVLRVLIDRVKFLENEKHHQVNKYIIVLLSISVWLFEFRASTNRGHDYFHGLDFSVNSKVCEKCGHTDCRNTHI